MAMLANLDSFLLCKLPPVKHLASITCSTIAKTSTSFTVFSAVARERALMVPSSIMTALVMTALLLVRTVVGLLKTAGRCRAVLQKRRARIVQEINISV